MKELIYIVVTAVASVAGAIAIWRFVPGSTAVAVSLVWGFAVGCVAAGHYLGNRPL